MLLQVALEEVETGTDTDFGGYCQVNLAASTPGNEWSNRINTASFEHLSAVSCSHDALLKVHLQHQPAPVRLPGQFEGAY